jgi:hypothetical protein
MLQLNIADTAMLLLGASTIGVVDVFWFHLHKFRLYRQQSSAAEEAVHLASYTAFIGLGAALLSQGGDGAGHGLVLALFGVQLVLTATDVLLEPRSRAPLGGLPAVEYLFHILVTFGIGGAAATFWWTTRTDGAAPLRGMERAQVLASIGFTSVLAVVEGALYLRAILARLPRQAAIPTA